MIYVCIYIYNIYRYIHTRTYINMYTFTARGDNARVISRNRYIKVCSRRRTRSIASNSPGGSRRALAGKAAEHPPTSSINFSAQKSRRPIGWIHSFLPSLSILRTDREARIGSTTAACPSREEKILSKYRAGKCLPSARVVPATCAYIYYTACHMYILVYGLVYAPLRMSASLYPCARVCIYVY